MLIRAAMAAMAKRVPALEKNGGDRAKDQVGLPNLKTGNQNSEYLIARIKRDRPDIADRISISSATGSSRQPPPHGE